MSSFKCSKCGVDILDTEKGYITGCKHYPLENIPISSWKDHAEKLEAEKAELIEVLRDVTLHACFDPLDGNFFSMYTSSYSNALRLLAKHGKVQIISDSGCRVIAKGK